MNPRNRTFPSFFAFSNASAAPPERKNNSGSFWNETPNGTGLGLWISRGIVDKHRGQIQARSRLSNGCGGTVFSLLLPASPFEQYGECA
ncbi:MAG: ATP-binding protein [Acidobacteriaceae bacterium]